MDTIRQRLLNKLPASRTSLARVIGINEYHGSAGACCLVGREVHELSPGYVSNAFSDSFKSAFSHLLNIQFFKRNDLVCVDKFPGKFMRKILTFVGDTTMDACNYFATFLPYRRIFFGFTQLSLSFCKFLFFGSEKSGVLNLFAIGKGSKRRKPDIDAHYGINFGQRLRYHLARERGIPFSSGISTNCQGFHGSLNIPMFAKLKRANLGHFQLVPNNLKAGLGECERIISMPCSESWKSWLFASFNAAKERFECKVYAKLSILKTLRKGIFQIKLLFFPLSQKFTGVIQRQRFLMVFPCCFSGLKRCIVCPSTRFKRGVELVLLIPGRIEAILIGFTHMHTLNHLCVRINGYLNEGAIHLPLKRGSLLAKVS